VKSSDAIKRVVVDIVGPPGSGKSKLCADLRQEYGFEIYRPSDVIRAYARAHNIALSGRQDYVTCHEALNAEDPDAIPRPALESTAQYLCVDGMRSPIPFLTLRQKIGAKLIYLECPPEIRLERIRADDERSGHRRIITLESLLADEAADDVNMSRNVANMVEMRQLADYVIDASKPYTQVWEAVCDTIRKLQEANT